VSGVHNFYSAQAFDGFLHLYSPNFNSAAALTDVLAGDDDMTTLNGGSVPNRNGVTTTEDSGFQFNLTANTPYVVVTSSFTASTTTPAAGAYYNEIYAPSTPATPRSPITTIPDATSSTVPGSQIVIPLSISDLGTVVSLNSVTLLGIDHTFLGDLVIKLRHASSGTTIDLIDRHGKTTAGGFGSSADLLSTNTYTIAPTGTALSTTGILATGTYAQNVNTPVGGSSADDGTFASFASLPLNGAWELLVQDFGTGDIGSISGFSINVTIPEPATLVTVAGFAVLALRRRRN